MALFQVQIRLRVPVSNGYVRSDKEQRLTLIQDFYDEWQSDIAESRHLLPKRSEGGGHYRVFTAEDALAYGLVDTSYVE